METAAVYGSNGSGGGAGYFRCFGIVRLLVAGLLLFLSPAIHADSGGGISGTVRDIGGSVIPSTAVVVRNIDTQIQQSTRTDAQGFYAFTSLPVGPYEIEVLREGLKQYRRTSLKIDVGINLRVDVTLEMGEQFENMTVSDSGVHLETETAQMGEVMANAKITAIPLNGRSYTDLLNLQPGIIPVGSQPPNAIIMAGVTTAAPSGALNAGNMSINGQRETANGFMVNGSNVEENLNMGAAVIPNLDSISEFRILTNNFEAEYGNYSGGQILVVTKSGTNQFHGNVFEFVRNTSLNAKNFFSPQRAKFEQNQFGGTLGGPVRHGKIFFFTDYQGSRTTDGVETGVISVPSLENRAGNLADIRNVLTGTVTGQNWAQILAQRLGYGVSPGEPYYTSGCSTPAQCVFPNAVIPQRAWSAPSRNLLAYIPRPNQSASDFYISSVDEVLRDDKGAARADADTRWGLLSAYYFVDDYRVDNPYPVAQGGANVPGFNAISTGRAQLVSLSAVKSFGANAVNEFHFSYMRDANNIGKPVGGVGPSLASQGFVTGAGTPGIVPLDLSIEGVENVALNNFTIGVDITGTVQNNNTFQWTDTFSKVVGKHTIKFGGEFHYAQINSIPNPTFNGTFSFNGNETGSDIADFLLGISNNYVQADGPSFYTRNKYAGLFVRDSWRARSNLTVDYGLRWDRISPWYEKYDRLQTLVAGRQSVVYPGAPEGFVFPGDPGIARTIAPGGHGDFSPRLGIAFAPSFKSGWLKKIFGGAGKTSMRAGFGMFYTAIEGLSAGIMYSIPPFAYNYISPAPVLFETPFITAADGTDNGQKFPYTFPVLGASASHPNTSIDWTGSVPISGDPAFAPDNRAPYAEHYNVSIERQFGADTLIRIAYVGSQAHHLLVITPSNPGNPQLCLALRAASGPAACGPFHEDPTRPVWPNFGSDTFQKTVGNSSYNSLELSLRHSSARAEILIGYTYSKSIDLSSNLGEEVNPFDLRQTRAISAFDMRHNFVASYRYDLPFPALLRRKNRLTEGWSISGTTRFTTGLPITLRNNQDTSLLGTYANGVNNNLLDEPNLAAGPLNLNTNPRGGRAAFNASLFSLPDLGQLGSAPRRFFHGPGISNFDLSLEKNVRLAESHSLQFRVEAFNAFNHAQFYGPVSVNGNISSSNFGQIVSAAAPRLIQLAAKFTF